MKKTTLALALATGSLLVGGTAVAQTAKERGPMTRDAVLERVDARFDKMDANSDGVLNPADREAKALEHFAAADTNGDGALSQDEFLAAREARMEERKQRREARAERRGGERMARRGERGGRGGPAAMLRRADTNNDGQVTKAEMQAAALARFDRVDADGDGTISREERQEARKAMRAARGTR